MVLECLDHFQEMRDHSVGQAGLQGHCQNQGLVWQIHLVELVLLYLQERQERSRAVDLGS